MNQEQEYPRETTISIEEATDLFSFLNRRKLVMQDYRGNHYEEKKWRYLFTDEILKQEKPFQFEKQEYPYKGRIIGNDVFVATLDEADLTICHYLNRRNLSKGEDERFESNQVAFARDTGEEAKYKKTKYIDWPHFWPFYHGFGLPDDFRENFERDNKDKGRTKKFKIRLKDDYNLGRKGFILDRDELLGYLEQQFGCESLGDELKSVERKTEGIYGAYVEIDGLSKIKRFGTTLLPLAPTISDNCLCLVTPQKEDRLYLQHNIQEGLEKALVQEEAKPKNLGNGVIVMAEDRIPKYLKRSLGL